MRWVYANHSCATDSWSTHAQLDLVSRLCFTDKLESVVMSTSRAYLQNTESW
ncbi:Hypothetical predicted protein [Pelobates cultripes]|uniref:Uncharacterized protein n=1 Tax=Pelobates cultripes TaxID=61616 RepID=A0AAD1R6A0_PELCU|nr:Hypothetical predicted protein [Pelobates cultripes]